jgi:uncharacterized RDD family membrane protein YckC
VSSENVTPPARLRLIEPSPRIIPEQPAQQVKPPATIPEQVSSENLISAARLRLIEPPPRIIPEQPPPQIKPPATIPEQLSSEDLTPPGRYQLDEQPQDWREELSERVENFRKRRARLHPEADSAGNLELDFENAGNPRENRSMDDTLGAPGGGDSRFDWEIGKSALARGRDDQPRETLLLEKLDDEAVRYDAAPSEMDEMSLGEPPAQNSPMEILVGSPPWTAPEEEEEVADGIYLAPLGRRFVAGLADALVLMLGAALFGTIFWLLRGRLSLTPLNLAVLGFVTVILIFAYFAVFTAIASATPGLLWMGCEIRNLQGEYPNARESAWRAFGVLVSLSALMLGFVWAYVDSDNLTWHDRMSGTAITEAQIASDLTGVKAEV